MSGSLEERYLNLICDIYPNIAVEWGRAIKKDADFTNEGIEESIKRLKTFYSEVRTERNSEIQRYIKKNIELRIFELTEFKENLFSSYFYYKLSINSVMILLDDFVIYKYGFNYEILKYRLEKLPEVLNWVMNEMVNKKFAYIDIFCSIKVIKDDLLLLEEKKHYFQELNLIFADVGCAIDTFLNFLINMKNSIENKFELISYGKKNILEYIKKYTYLKITDSSLESYYQKAFKILEEANEVNIKNEFSDNYESFSQKIVWEVIEEIYENSKNVFGCCDNLLYSLNIKELNDEKYKNGLFYYVAVENKQNIEGCLFYSSSYKYQFLSDLKLKLIHEIYPGHHYLRIKRKRNNLSDIANWIKEDVIAEEGWAKYCEYYYVYNIDKSEEMITSYNISLYFMALMFFVTMEIHYYNKNINQVIHLIKQITNLEKREILSLIINANREPIEYLGYFIGYNFYLEKGIQLKDFMF